MIGLYTSFFPVVFYLVFGTCRHISMGTNALLALLTSSIVEREFSDLLASRAQAANVTSPLPPLAAAADPALGGVTREEEIEFKVGVVNAITFISGCLLLSLGVLRYFFSN